MPQQPMTPAEFDAAVALGISRSACTDDHLKGLMLLVKQTQDVPGHIVEIGSYRCGATIAIAAAAQVCSPNKRVFAFDTFSGMPAVSEFDEHRAGDFGDANFSEIQEVVKPFSNINLVRGVHEETIPGFPINPLSLIFMDSDLYGSHVVALKYLWPRLSPDGIIVFHDWNTADCPGVKKAITEFVGDSPFSSTLCAGMLAIKK
jgi:predicted O-methyltransferase YrrM